jgi:putative effector of murein hydrolase
MNETPFSLWVYLSQSPLLWLTVTLLTYAVTDAVSLRTDRHPLANPVLLAIGSVGGDAAGALIFIALSVLPP